MLGLLISKSKKVIILREGIAFAGTIAVDEIKKIKKYPGKSELASINHIYRSSGGAVSNCGVSMAKIDPELPIDVIALIGDDNNGQFLMNTLQRYPNIDVTQLITMGKTPFTDVFQDETDHSRTFFAFRGNSDLFDENTIDFTNVNSKILHIAYILLLDSLDQEDPEFGTKMAYVLKKARNQGIKTSIDVVSENSDRYEKIVPPSLKYTNYCVINELEAGKTVGLALRDHAGALRVERIKEVLIRLADLGVEDWVIIHCPEGSFGYDGSNYTSVPSLHLDPQSIKGTVGAGDAFVTGVLYGALKELSIKDAMILGTASAASSLMGEDSTSGVLPYAQLTQLYQDLPKREEILI